MIINIYGKNILISLKKENRLIYSILIYCVKNHNQYEFSIKIIYKIRIFLKSSNPMPFKKSINL